MKNHVTDSQEAAAQGLGKPTRRCIDKDALFLADVPLGLGGWGFEKPTKRCIVKEPPSLIDVPLGLGGKSDQRVHR